MQQELPFFDPPAGDRATPLRLTGGARAAEEGLLAEIGLLLDEAATDPGRLRLPVRVVVPSASLRLHLAAVLLRRRGRAVLGLKVQSLYGLALEVVEAAGERLAIAPDLFDLLARRQARQHRPLRDALEHLRDGYATVAATARDLADAGFEPVHAAALEELLAAEGEAGGFPGPTIARARAVVRATAEALGALADLGAAAGSTLLRRAADLVAAGAGEVLPARAILVYGFAEATGVATDLIEALVRHAGALAYVDEPPDPAVPGGRERAFVTRLVERLGGAAGSPRAGEESGAPRSLRAVVAPGTEAEMRAVAEEVAGLLQGGAAVEEIGVVARDFAHHLAPLRRQLTRLGIPFSGAGGVEGPLAPFGRRFQALLSVFEEGEGTPVDRWLDALGEAGVQRLLGSGWRDRRPSLFDLRLALRALGAVRLGQLPEVEISSLLDVHGFYPLPIRQGVWRGGESAVERGEVPADDEEPEETEAGAPERPGRLSRRRLHGAVLERALAAGKACADRLAAWPDRASLAAHRATLATALAADLGWDEGEVAEIVEALAPGVADGLPVSRPELLLLLRRCSDRLALRAPLGGKGGGVQVLSATESRGRTFAHLFLVGLSGDLFPRTAREDPLLPDELRRPLAAVLPDLGVKLASAHDEERHLFAQLLSAAPEVTLAWSRSDPEGRPLTTSPLVERLRWEGALAPPREAPPILSPPEPDAAAPRPADEAAILAGLYGSHEQYAAALPVALHAAAGEHPAGVSVAAWAAGRLAVLSELDPDGRGRRRLGPYFGFVGGALSPDDPRHHDLYVTTLERFARCPWQTFVERLLRIAPTPDPLQALPGVDARLLGGLVHRVLEMVVTEEGELPRELADALAVPPRPIRWPELERLEEICRREAEALLKEEGIPLRGLVRVLVERARAPLHQAGELDWPLPGARVALRGTEVTGSLATAGGRPLFFRADRVDEADGGTRLTDYKTGKPISTAKTPAKREEHLQRSVARGEVLQAVAYLLGAGAAAGDGRYLYLKDDPALPVEARVARVTPADLELITAFERSVGVLLAAWERGAFFPRLVEVERDREPTACRWCRVAEACLRGDSGARRRLFGWAERHRGEGAAVETAAETALLAVFALAAGDGGSKEAPE